MNRHLIAAWLALAGGLFAQAPAPSNTIGSVGNGSSGGGPAGNNCAAPTVTSGAVTVTYSNTVGCAAITVTIATTVTFAGGTGYGPYYLIVTNATPTSSPLTYSGITETGVCQPDASSANAVTTISIVQRADGSYFPVACSAASSGLITPGQILKSQGAIGPPLGIDFPERLMIPAANCNAGTAAAAWSIPSSSGGTASCRAGTNNLGGVINLTDSTTAQFQLSIPTDWDTATNPYILFGLISTDTTNGHTIIPQIKISCPTATNGTVTDDHAFAAAHSATTITIGGSAVSNGFYATSVQMNSTDMVGCVAGGMMIVQVGRATDTATGADIFFEYADVTFPRFLAVQAN